MDVFRTFFDIEVFSSKTLQQSFSHTRVFRNTSAFNANISIAPLSNKNTYAFNYIFYL